MITKNIGMLLLAIYLIAVGILTLTGLGIGYHNWRAGAGGRNFYPDRALSPLGARQRFCCVTTKISPPVYFLS